LPAAFAFCRSQQMSGPGAAAVLCYIARFRRENVVEFAAHVQPVWLLLDSCFAAYVKEREAATKRLPEHLSLSSMMGSNVSAAVALTLPPGRVTKWLDAVGTRLSAADIGVVLAKQPEAVTAAPEKAVAALDWAADVLAPRDLARLVRGVPLLLQVETTTLQRKLGTIAAAAGLSAGQARKLALKMPSMLTAAGEETMQEAGAWLQ
jgi:hypothetical protein